jgi:uncharacterized protein YndB with AHSA1/START domain
MTRQFDAPRDLVFEAHSSCEHMSKWWGPRRYEVDECEIDFRDGGKWRMVHRSPEGGQEFGFHGEYLEIVRPEKITWTFEFEGAPGHVSLDRLSLEEHDGRTTVRTHSVYQSLEARNAMVESGMAEGMNEGFDRLDALLARLSVPVA